MASLITAFTSAGANRIPSIGMPICQAVLAPSCDEMVRGQGHLGTLVSLLSVIICPKPESSRLVKSEPVMNLDEWMESTFPNGNVEDYYPLSSVQEGMLLHALREPRATLFFQQIVPLDNMDLRLFVEALNQVVARHTILRTFFHWEGLEEPVQVVHREVRIPVAEMNWSNVPRVDRTVCRRHPVTSQMANPEGIFRSGLTGQAKIRGEETIVAIAFTKALVRFMRVEIWSWLP